MPLHEKLKLLLADRRITVIAKRAGVQPITVHQYKSGRCEPSRKVAVKLAALLGVSVGWLLDDSQGFPPVLSNPSALSEETHSHAMAAA